MRDFAATLEIGGETYNFTVDYLLELTPVISDVSPNLVSAIEPTLLTIVGKNLGDSPADVEITLAGDRCIIRSFDASTADSTVVTCMWYPVDNTALTNCDVQCELQLDGVERKPHDLAYIVLDRGLAAGGTANALEVDVAFEINSVTPQAGSLVGGTLLTIVGAGFGVGQFFPTTVTIGNGFPASLCDVIEVNLTYMECYTRVVAANDEERAQSVEATIRNIPSECKPSGTESCQFTYTADFTPTMTVVDRSAATARDPVEISGSNFGSTLDDIAVYFVAIESASSSSPTINFKAKVLGAPRCNLLNVSDSSITCNPPGEAPPGFYSVVVQRVAWGLAVPLAPAVKPVFPVIELTPEVISIAPTSGWSLSTLCLRCL